MGEPGQSPPAAPPAAPQRFADQRRAQDIPLRHHDTACVPPLSPHVYFPPVLAPTQGDDYEQAIDMQEQAYRQQRRLQELEQGRREQQWEEERQRRSDPRLER